MTSLKIDSRAAPCTRQDDDDELKKAMQTLGQPKGDTPITPKRRGCTKAPANADAKTELKVDLKSEITLKELQFLEIYLTGEHSINNAMKLAGYKDMTDRNRYLLAKKIVCKHESRAGDPRKILRMAGLGEIKIALTILELMKSDSQTVRVRACELAAKCLGMTKEGAELPQGISIIIKGRDQAVQVNVPGAPPRPTTSCGQVPGSTGLSAAKPICITK